MREVPQINPFSEKTTFPERPQNTHDRKNIVEKNNQVKERFSPKQLEMIAKLIAEGKRARAFIEAQDEEYRKPLREAAREINMPEEDIEELVRSDYYDVPLGMHPTQVDRLVDSLKQSGISWKELPDEALSAIKVLRLTEIFENQLTSPTIDDLIKDKKKIFITTSFRDGQPALKEMGESQKEFFAEEIERVQDLEYRKEEKLSQKNNISVAFGHVDVDKTHLQEEIDTLSGHIQSMCESIVNFVTRSQKPFEVLFPYVESDVKDFIYKEAGVDLEEKPLEEVA